jgi:predicted transposase/invertase (TIGR01784 family)
MFDPTCKFLVESFPADFATWLLGEPITLTKLSPTELSIEPIRADSLILLNADTVVLHTEFQTEPDPAIGFRMADYYLRVFRRFPEKQMRQIVIYLTPSGSGWVQQTVFETEVMRHQFSVIRLWEQPTQMFLESTGLLPLAVLTQTVDKAQTLRQVAAVVEAIPDRRVQSNIAASAGILAGLTLKQDVIHQVLRKEIMQQSVIYQEWRQEFLQEGEIKGREEGLQQGRQEGRQEGRRQEALAIVLRLLQHQFGSFEVKIQTKVQALSVEKLEDLSQALLDFRNPSDLLKWLQTHS